MTVSSELRRIIGSSLMVGVRGAEPGDPVLERDLDVCANANVGGVILFDVDLSVFTRLVKAGVQPEHARDRALRNIISPDQTRSLIAHIRQRLGEGVIVAVDHEGGRTTRLSPRRGFAQTIDSSAYASLPVQDQQREVERLAHVASDAGFDLNFAPCVDLAINPDNPIITQKGRSFGSDSSRVADCARTILEAHRRAGVMTCLKHFPGHGAASLDSHVSLPDLTGRATRDAELAPYSSLISDVDTSTWVMTGHLLDRHVDETLPASLSFAHTTACLRDAIGFRGVVVTDSLDMGAIANRWPIERAAVMAIQAGADVALDGVNAPGPSRDCPALRMVEAIESALDAGRIEGGEARLRESAERIRRAREALRAIRPH